MRNRIQPLLCELHAHTTWSDGSLSVREPSTCTAPEGSTFSASPITPSAPTIRGSTGRSGRHAAYGARCMPRTSRTFFSGRSRPSPVRPARASGRRADVQRRGSRRSGARGRRRPQRVRLRRRRHRRSHRDGPWGRRRDHRGAPVRRRAVRDREPLHPQVRGRSTPGLARPPVRASTGRRCSAGSLAQASPVVANGDFHERDHIGGWKTLLPCERDAEAVIAYLRSARPVYLTRVEDELALPVAA